ERQADEIADRVVSGQSVEGLLASSLGPAAPRGAGAASLQSAPLQMKLEADAQKGEWYMKGKKVYEVVDDPIHFGNGHATVRLREALTGKTRDVDTTSKKAVKYQHCPEPPSPDDLQGRAGRMRRAGNAVTGFFSRNKNTAQPVADDEKQAETA